MHPDNDPLPPANPPKSLTEAESLSRAEAFVRARCAHDSGGHDFHHLRRVRALALRLAEPLGADPFVTEMAAWLHDVADPKLNPDPLAGRRELAGFLEGLSLSAERRARVEDVVERVSFGKELDGDARPKSPELMAVQDADRLDAIGALGIARAFAYGGSKGQPMHDPDLPPRRDLDHGSYRAGKSTSVNHFHEKLLTLKGRLNSEAARAIAEGRHRFMEAFLERFLAEWEGNG
ncbi:MAG: HD domain-containing protein [Fibrobacteres bacterium]|nr:HD domain-containing protein [Fibrobacterota bacterium]